MAKRLQPTDGGQDGDVDQDQPAIHMKDIEDALLVPGYRFKDMKTGNVPMPKLITEVYMWEVEKDQYDTSELDVDLMWDIKRDCNNPFKAPWGGFDVSADIRVPGQKKTVKANLNFIECVIEFGSIFKMYKESRSAFNHIALAILTNRQFAYKMFAIFNYKMKYLLYSADIIHKSSSSLHAYLKQVAEAGDKEACKVEEDEEEENASTSKRSLFDCKYDMSQFKVPEHTSEDTPAKFKKKKFK